MRADYFQTVLRKCFGFTLWDEYCVASDCFVYTINFVREQLSDIYIIIVRCVQWLITLVTYFISVVRCLTSSSTWYKYRRQMIVWTSSAVAPLCFSPGLRRSTCTTPHRPLPPPTAPPPPHRSADVVICGHAHVFDQRPARYWCLVWQSAIGLVDWSCLVFCAQSHLVVSVGTSIQCSS